jgi:hypothetical protein
LIHHYDYSHKIIVKIEKKRKKSRIHLLFLSLIKASSMQILMMIWTPTAAWRALTSEQQVSYLETLTPRLNAARSQGMMVIGWSKVDAQLPKAPFPGRESYVGVFGLDNPTLVQEMEARIASSGWYDYFESTNVSVSLTGATEAEPHHVYANLLGLGALAQQGPSI